MNFRILPIVTVLVLFTFACGGPKVLISNKNNAESAMAAGDYVAAEKSWTQYFNETPVEEVDGADFARAAKVAFKSGDSSQAVNWFDQARYKNYSDFEMYLTLAEIYREQKNISKELSALEYISEKYPAKTSEINNRLFQVYNEIKLTDKALEVWNQLNETSKNEASNLIRYFLIQKELKDSTVCDSVALVVLDKNPNQVDALEWTAMKYYWQGENRYQKEMAKYNANKTTRQYNILLKELDKSTADFKKSLTYFEKLWKQNPGEKYAGYFANIYARFGDESKVKYYEKYLK